LNCISEQASQDGVDYLLHLEDDWFFIRDDDFISKALAVMDADSSISQVLINPDYADTDADWEASALLHDSRHITPDGVPYLLHTFAGLQGSEQHRRHLAQHNVQGSNHLHWPGFALRPGLWRMSAIREVGRFEDRSWFEEAYGLKAVQLGFKTAMLAEVSCIHLAPSAVWLQERAQDISAVYKRHGLRLQYDTRRPLSAYLSNASDR